MTSGGGFGLNLETQVRLMVEPLSTCMSGPPRTSVVGSENKQDRFQTELRARKLTGENLEAVRQSMQGILKGEVSLYG